MSCFFATSPGSTARPGARRHAPLEDAVEEERLERREQEPLLARVARPPLPAREPRERARRVVPVAPEALRARRRSARRRRPISREPRHETRRRVARRRPRRTMVKRLPTRCPGLSLLSCRAAPTGPSTPGSESAATAASASRAMGKGNEAVCVVTACRSFIPAKPAPRGSTPSARARARDRVGRGEPALPEGDEEVLAAPARRVGGDLLDDEVLGRAADDGAHEWRRASTGSASAARTAESTARAGAESGRPRPPVRCRCAPPAPLPPDSPLGAAMSGCARLATSPPSRPRPRPRDGAQPFLALTLPPPTTRRRRARRAAPPGMASIHGKFCIDKYEASDGRDPRRAARRAPTRPTSRWTGSR